MKKRLFGSILSAVVLAAFAFSGVAWEADFQPSNYNPNVDETITLAVCEPCLDDGSYRYWWDFDGDGARDVETDDPSIEHAFDAAGFYEVELTLVDEIGHRKVSRRGILVGALPAYAVRETVEQGDGTILVLITIHAAAPMTVPALEETMVRGWQFELVDDGAAFVANPNAEIRTFQIAWGDAFEAGAELTCSYRLHPTRSSGPITQLAGTISGRADDKRFSGPICGRLEIEY